MTTALDPAPARPGGPLAPRRPLLPPGTDVVALALLVGGFAVLYVPTYLTLAREVWPSDEQGHGPVVLVVAFVLLWAARDRLAHASQGADLGRGLPVLLGSLLLYVVGRSQFVLFFEVASQIPVIAGLVLCFLGMPGLRAAGFALLILCFMVPLPPSLVAEFTGPLKTAASGVAAATLHTLGYPVGRAGVVLSVGPYQLLVADACAGLNSMITLCALTLLYLRSTGTTARWRIVALLLLTVPIAFTANVVRVMALVLVTFHFGDAAGQGFAHGFAGMLLFLVGLLLIVAADGVLRSLGRAHGTESR